MTERQDEVLTESIEQAKCQVVMVPAPMHRLLADVAQAVVHPAHVPFVAEAEPADISRPRYPGPRGRFLRDGDRARMVAVDQFVQPPQEGRGVEVLVAAVLVRDPLTGLAAVIEVE